MWDPDGSGLAPAKLVVAGDFGFAGTVPVRNIAAWDGSTWSDLSGGLSGPGSGGLTGWNVYALAVLPSGELVAAGNFTLATNFGPMNLVAKWNGSQWSPLGTGLERHALFGPDVTPVACYGLVVRPNGDLIAVGSFDTAGGVPASGIARWDGAAWAPFEQGFQVAEGIPTGFAAALSPNGDVIVGGIFDSISSVSANNIARWNGSSWSPLGPGSQVNLCRAIDVLPSGEVVAGGGFVTANGTVGIARWNGSVWSSLGAGIGTLASNSQIFNITHAGSGEIYVAGQFSVNPVAGPNAAIDFARWDGTAWSRLGPAGKVEGSLESHFLSRPCRTVTIMPNGDIAVGGGLKGGIIAWNGASWTNFGSGFDAPISDLATALNGDIIAVGSFERAGSALAHRVARFNGSDWSRLGNGIDGFVRAILPLSNGDVLISFTASSNPSSNPTISRWNGSAWTPQGFGWRAEDLAVDNNGVVLAAGGDSIGLHANVARFDGSNWVPFTSTGFTQLIDAEGNGILIEVPGNVSYLAVLPDNTVVASGNFDHVDGVLVQNIARFNGNAWIPLGNDLGGPTDINIAGDMVVLSNGDLIVGGSFNMIAGISGLNNIARWDGSEWSALGEFGLQFPARSLAVLPSGVLIANTSDATVNGHGVIAAWDGTDWTDLTPPLSSIGLAMTALPDGDVAVGGSFLSAGNTTSVYFARFGCVAPVCPADFNNSENVTVQDIFDFLAAWFAGNTTADFNHVGGVTVQDIFDFLSAWFAGCP